VYRPLSAVYSVQAPVRSRLLGSIHGRGLPNYGMKQLSFKDINM
jgi:hypothetical protein